MLLREGQGGGGCGGPTVRPLEVARLQVLYNSQLRRVRDLQHELELARSGAARREAGLRAELENARADTEDALCDLSRTSAELQASNVKVGEMTQDLSAARQKVHELGHQTALTAAEVAAANTLIADLHMQIKEQQQAMASGTVMGGSVYAAVQQQQQQQQRRSPSRRLANPNTRENVGGGNNNYNYAGSSSVMDPIERMIKHQPDLAEDVDQEQYRSAGAGANADGPDAVAEVVVYASAAGGGAGGDAVDRDGLLDVNDNDNDEMTQPLGAAAVAVAAAAAAHLPSPPSRSASDTDLAAALELDTSEDELAMPTELAMGGPPMVAPAAATAALHEARQQIDTLCHQVDEQAGVIAELQYELDVAVAAAQETAEQHALQLDNATSKLALVEQQGMAEARADSLALYTAAEAKLKAELFKLKEELTAVKQQFIVVCGEKQTVERQSAELGSQCADLQAGKKAAEERAAAHRAQLSVLQVEANVISVDSEQQIAALSDQTAAVVLELEQLKAANTMLRTSLADAQAAKDSVPQPPETATQEAQTAPAPAVETSMQESQTAEPDAAAASTQTEAPTLVSSGTGVGAADFAATTAVASAQTEGEPPCCADSQEQLHALQAQHEVHLTSAAEASAAAEAEKARCLTELQGSYQEAIQKLVAGVEKNLEEARRGSGQRLERALKRGTTLVAQRLNDRYMNAIQLIFEHVVNASGETAAQSLAEKAFASQGFKVNITEESPPPPQQQQQRRQQYGYSKRHVGSTTDTTESTPLHYSSHRHRGFGRHLLDEVAAAGNVKDDGRGASNRSMLNSSALLTPSPTPSPKSSPHAAGNEDVGGRNTNRNLPVAAAAVAVAAV